MIDPTIVLKSTIKQYTYDQDKAIHPQETVRKVLDTLASSNLNILANLYKKNVGVDIPIYIAKGGIDFISTINLSYTTGKGATDYQAQASALMEMIERYSSATYEYKYIYPYKVIKCKMIDFELFFPLLNKIKTHKDILESLKEVPMFWTPAYNLTHNYPTLFPFIYSEIVQSNGLAAGNTLEEAILQGLCEVVERHILSIIDLDKPTLPTIDINSIKDPLAISLINKYKDINMEIIIKDCTLDMQIPTIGVIGYYKSGIDKKEWGFITAGTHTSPIKALYRALTELPQCLRNLALINKLEERIQFANEGIIYSGIISQENIKNIQKTVKLIDFKHIKDISDQDIKKEIELCIEILNNKGVEVIVINKTNPLLNIPVVRVCAPQLLLNTKSTNLAILYYQALCYKKINKIDEAINILKDYIYNYSELCKTSKLKVEYKYDIYLQLATLYNTLAKKGSKNYIELAIENFKKCLEIKPKEDSIIYCELANLYLKQNNVNLAEEYFNKALKLEPLYINTPLYEKIKIQKKKSKEASIIEYVTKELENILPSNLNDYKKNE